MANEKSYITSFLPGLERESSLDGMSIDEIKDISVNLEAHETPYWAPRELLKVELMPQHVLDPCCGRGVLNEAALSSGYNTSAIDIFDWGYDKLAHQKDFLSVTDIKDVSDFGNDDFGVFVNPPFSLSCEFVSHAFKLGARKVVCFQRMAWRESNQRRTWFMEYTPARIWLCGDRATCWRFDKLISGEQVNGDSGSNVTYAFFVFERGHKGAELMSTIHNN